MHSCRYFMALFSSAFLHIVPAGNASADEVFTENVIVDARLCVGGECVDGEAFAGIELKIKDSRPILRFEDTSTGAFAGDDWQFLINEGFSGGLDSFTIGNASRFREPFVIEGNARTHTLYLDAGGRVGIGTSMPTEELEIVSAATPTIALTQSGGSNTQIWEIGGDPERFFVRDATGTSGFIRYPFEIEPDAPSRSLYIQEDGDIGLGLSSPRAPLHVRRFAGAAIDMLRLENNEGVVLRMMDTAANGQEWTVQSNNGLFRISSPAVPGPELRLDDNGNLTITGQITTSGSCGAGCDRVFDQDYPLPSIENHAAQMWAQKHLPAIGPTTEEGPFNLTDKVGGLINELEHAHIYIARQQAEIVALRQDMIRLETLVKEMRAQ